MLPINLTVCGDLTIVLYHARNALKGMVRPQGLKICQFQINTGFVPEPETLITFNAHDLDDLPDPEQVPANFCVSLSLSVTDTETLPSHKPPWLPAKSKRTAQNLFSSDLEYAEMLDNFGKLAARIFLFRNLQLNICLLCSYQTHSTFFTASVHKKTRTRRITAGATRCH